MENTRNPIAVYAEGTPNPATMMFVADKPLIPGGQTLEFTEKSQTKGAPLPAQLFNFPFVTSVFMTGNFITVTKNDTVSWDNVALQLREFIQEYLSAGNPAVISLTSALESQKKENARPEAASFHNAPASETEARIVEILEEYVRPAVEGDGGAIHFKSFKDGIVTVVLRGSCSGCPSSSITLKSGIEGLLKRMIPEVKEVVAESL